MIRARHRFVVADVIAALDAIEADTAENHFTVVGLLKTFNELGVSLRKELRTVLL